MFVLKAQLEATQAGEGITLRPLGHSQNLSVRHWVMADGATVPTHDHPEEQFGYVIRGGFRMWAGDEEATLGEGDSYFIAADVPHGFEAIGETEAIDVFSPPRLGLPNHR
jgi:quercetin dioxygenase-like cupin family protein